jgi:Uma2 family endonuclease
MAIRRPVFRFAVKTPTIGTPHDEDNGMASATQANATLDDLYRTPEKAELIGGRIVRLLATGRKPGRIGGRIYRSLDDYANEFGGEAFPDNVGFAVAILPSGRESFSPGASWHAGPFPKDPMRFIEGAPTFAVEVRSECDYDATAESEMAQKRADYFQAGTLVVWDVDTLAECIYAYRSDDPDRPLTFRRGQTVHAEPAVLGWQVDVDWIFL